MHPSGAIWCSKSEKLKGKRIVLAVTGSIATVESVKLIRELIRHGAEVFPVMSPESQRIMHPNALRFASGNRPVTEIGGDVPYIELLEGETRAHILLIAPCTSNTLSKIANGISDTTVTLFATQAIGLEIPIIIVPSMHLPMFKNPIIANNIKTLKKMGVEFIDPKVEESVAKLPGLEEMVSKVIRSVGNYCTVLSGKRVAVIGGAAQEPIDDVRSITPYSSGATAVELARAAYEKGADVQLIMGRCEVPLPEYLPTKRFVTVSDLLKSVQKIKYEICLVPAALSDYAPKRTKGKIPSDLKGLKLELKPLPKVIDTLRKKQKCFLVGFKVEHGITKKELITRASKRLKSAQLSMIVANDLTKVGKVKSEVVIIDKKGKMEELKGSRAQIAEGIWSAIIYGIK